MKNLDNILVIDTVGEKAIIGLNGKILSWESKRNHSDQLLVQLDKLIRSQGLDRSAVEGVVVGVGPSISFTGVRVGITVANGIGFALQVPVAGVTEFDIIRQKYKTDWIFLDAKRNEVFAEGKTKFLISVNELEKKIKKNDSVYMPAELVSRGFPELNRAGTIYMSEPSTDERIALMLRAAKMPKQYKQVLPVYMREANITKSKLKPN